MITDKEYPATHSMSTAWYAADEDGNVAIINYNENGPVPWGTETDLCIENIIWGDDEDSKDLSITMTDDQIDEMIENPHHPKTDSNWWYNCAIQIDTAKEKLFLELAKGRGFTLKKCLSKHRGLYLVDADMHVRGVKRTALQKMLDNEIIIKVFNLKNMDIEEDWVDEKVVFKKNFDNLPYFIYGQPYSIDFLSERLNIPRNPIKLSQFPETLRRRIPVLPIKFSEKKNFQIAEWVPTNVYTIEEDIVDGVEYSLLKLTDGTEAYVLTDLNADVFVEYCSEKEKYQCEENGRGCDNCCRCLSYQRTSSPTVMQIFSPFIDRFRFWDYMGYDEIKIHSVWWAFLQRIPYKDPQNYYLFPKDLEHRISRKQLEDYYLKSYRYLEDKIDCFKPRVLILDELSEEVMSKKYGISNGRMTICGVEYPVFKRSEMESRRAEIESLALLPYRGKKIPHIITVEEMKKLKGE